MPYAWDLDLVWPRLARSGVKFPSSIFRRCPAVSAPFPHPAFLSFRDSGGNMRGGEIEPIVA